MGQVNITIDGRSFKLGCGEGEEQHLLLLAEHVGKHIDNLKLSLGDVPDEQLYLVAGLMVCDELWDAREQLMSLQKDRTGQKEETQEKGVR